MAGSEETLVLTDASVEDQVRAALVAGGINDADLVVEPATDWPGQELAVDLYALDDAELATMIRTAKTILRRDVGITDAPTSAEYAHQAESAAS